jgi:tetratricopeptide (TPR) repeat protein/tRNA A-37 threonylcarbamoyl transferase component Bud32
MTAEQWRRVCEVFAAALRGHPSGRKVLLGEACGGDSDVRAEVERLLADDDRAAGEGLRSTVEAPPRPGEARREGRAPRDLLFALLALQNGLIDQTTLVAAFHTWTRAKDRPMAETLVAMGAIDGGDRALLEALAERHLRRHGDDTEKTLAAVGADRATRERLERIGDLELTATLSRVGTPPGDSGGASTEEAEGYSVGSASSGGQRFRVIRPHASGGIGAVFVALDAELNREVALKQILEHRADDPGSRARFLLEAEITGGLEHPGIVPVYGLGSDPDGRPFYAMRFIRGDSLKDVIAAFHAEPEPGRDPVARGLELRGLLRRFTDVCNAMEYAHGRGVLHRDLKPGNIIVGKHGETLVVDWGMAKAGGHAAADDDPEATERPLMPASASEHAETLPGSVVGTPSYMSPEQAAGDVGRLGPASDVYSLGATLYSLLTGKRPFADHDRGSVLQAVQRGDFTPPRALDRSIAPDLEAVCLKAMALRPEDRYAAPRALAEDLERWMADEPVTARRDPFAERAGRWARRHRTLVTTAAAATLVAAVTLGVAAVREARARARAESILLTAWGAADRFFLKMSDDNRLKAEGLEILRHDLLLEARDFFGILLEKTGDDPRLQAELGRTYLGLARISEWMKELPRAIDMNDRALAIYTKLASERPDDVGHAEGLARVYHVSGLARWGTPRSRADLEQAVERWGRLANAHPEVPAYRLEQAVSLNQLGSLLSNALGDPVGGEAAVRRALTLCDGLVEGHRGVLAYEHERAQSLCALGRSQDVAEDFGPAVDNLEAAVKIWSGLADREPADPEYPRFLAQAAPVLALAYCNAGRPERVAPLRDRAGPVVERQAQRHPDVPYYRRAAATIDAAVALALAMRGDHASAGAATAKAVARAEDFGSVRYIAACCYSSASGAALGDAALAAADRERTAGRYRSRALDELKEARRLGVFEYPSMVRACRSSRDFRHLSGTEEFRAFLKDLDVASAPARPAGSPRGR